MADTVDSPELVHLAVEAGIATITLDSPRNRNALSAQLRRELIAHLDAAIADDAVRVIVLTHTGTVFCAGMNFVATAGIAPEIGTELPMDSAKEAFEAMSAGRTAGKIVLTR